MYFRKKHPTGCLKQCLYITYGSTHVVVRSVLTIVPIKTPATPSFITNTTDMTRFKIASATALYLSFQKNPIDSLNTVTALLIPFSKKLMHKTSTICHSNKYFFPNANSTNGFNISNRQIAATPYIHCPIKNNCKKTLCTLSDFSITPRFPILAAIL